jgi:Retrotransposon gag protein
MGEPKRYNGKNRKEQRTFILQMENYLNETGFCEQTKIKYAKCYFDDSPLLWATRTTFRTLKEMLDGLKKRFGDKLEVEQAANELNEIKQGYNEDVRAYITKFSEIAERTEFSEYDKIFRFMNGSDLKISKNMITLDESKNLEELYEKSIYLQTRYEQWNRGSKYSTIPKNILQTQKKDNTIKINHVENSERTYKLTEEQERLKAEGKCYYCKEKGHRKAECKKIKRNNNQISIYNEEGIDKSNENKHDSDYLNFLYKKKTGLTKIKITILEGNKETELEALLDTRAEADCLLRKHSSDVLMNVEENLYGFNGTKVSIEKEMNRKKIKINKGIYWWQPFIIQNMSYDAILGWNTI